LNSSLRCLTHSANKFHLSFLILSETTSSWFALCERKEETVTDKKEEARRSPDGVRQTCLALCLWAIFAAGLLVQMGSPRLKIENNVFVMPPISDARQSPLRPDALVQRERWMQASSAILTLGGALALGVCYRRRLLAAVRG
jgi:hypothetical protein